MLESSELIILGILCLLHEWWMRLYTLKKKKKKKKELYLRELIDIDNSVIQVIFTELKLMVHQFTI